MLTTRNGSRMLAAPYAPAHLLGMGDTSPQGTPYPDQSYDIPINITLTALQTLQTAQIIERDADYVWRGIIANSQTGIYQVRFDINGWYLLSNGQITNANLASDPSAPYPIFPELVVPAGGRIGINITDLSNAGNTIQIVFRGVKRFCANAQ
jgi:hypothetical protein